MAGTVPSVASVGPNGITMSNGQVMQLPSGALPTGTAISGNPMADSTPVGMPGPQGLQANPMDSAPAGNGVTGTYGLVGGATHPDSALPPAPHPPIANHPGTDIPSALPNPDQKYVDAFNASMGAQRQAIDNQMASSVQQLGARRDAAAQVIAGLPAQFAAHYKAAGQDAKSMAKVMGGTVGGRQAAGGNANDVLAANMLSGGNAAANSTVPLLNLGNTANYGAGMTQIEATHAAGVQQVAQEQASFAAAQAGQATSAADAKSLWTTEHQEVDANGHPMFGSSGKPLMVPTTAANAPTASEINSSAQHLGYSSQTGYANATATGTSLVAHGKLNNVQASMPPSDEAWKAMPAAGQQSYITMVQKALGKNYNDPDVMQYLVNNGALYGPALHLTRRG